MQSRVPQEKIIPPPALDREAVKALSSALDLPEIAAALLYVREMRDPGQIGDFFNPSLERLHSPFLFPDMEKAVDRILHALHANQKICIYGDYDVDGITSIALLYRYFRSLGADVSYYIPDRLKEGYGLSDTGIRQIKERGTDLIVTVDCGITAEKEVALAAELGMDIIVTDHHLHREPLPKALALINPKLNNGYPDLDLSGVGVAFKLALALHDKLYPGEATEGNPVMDYLDLVSIGTLADIVPLVGENRALVRFGLERLKRSACEGVKALLMTSGLYDKEIQATSVVFQITPLINAAGRMGDPETALKLFITTDPSKAQEAAKRLKEYNTQRKALDQSITEQCCRMIDEKIDLDATSFLVLSSEGWHAGVMGIVASRLLEKYGRPVLLLSIEGDTAKGSARSINGFHVLTAIQSCADLLLDFGGHRQAAGLELETRNIPALAERLNAAARKELSSKDFTPLIKTDLEITDLDMFNWDTYNALKRFEPFGQSNSKPLFYASDLRVAGEPRIVGVNHLKFRVAHGRTTFDAVAFRMGHRLGDLGRSGSRVTLAFYAEENEYNGARSLQLNVRGIE